MAKQLKLTVESLHCVHSSQPGVKETIRLNIITNGYCDYSNIKSMTDGNDWQLNKTFILKENQVIQIEGLNNKPITTPIFMDIIMAQEKNLTTRSYKASDNASYYKLKYKIESDSTIISESTTEKTFNSTKRFVYSDGWGGLQLCLTDDSSSPYIGRYHQQDEKDSGGKSLPNYCGPTAGKNIAYWYGTYDDRYTDVGKSMKTNDYYLEPEIIAISANPFLPIPAPIILKAIEPGGTLPKYINSFLSANDVRPNNLSIKWKNEGNSPYKSYFGLQYEVRNRIKSGHPVVALIYTTSGSLHWLLITGFFLKNKKWNVRLANWDGYGRIQYESCDWDKFYRMWSLSRLDSVLRYFLTWIKFYPYTWFYY